MLKFTGTNYIILVCASNFGRLFKSLRSCLVRVSSRFIIFKTKRKPLFPFLRDHFGAAEIEVVDGDLAGVEAAFHLEAVEEEEEEEGVVLLIRVVPEQLRDSVVLLDVSLHVERKKKEKQYLSLR